MPLMPPMPPMRVSDVKPCRKCGGTRRGRPRRSHPFGECLDCVARREARRAKSGVGRLRRTLRSARYSASPRGRERDRARNARPERRKQNRKSMRARRARLLEAGLCPNHSIHLSIRVVEGRANCAACMEAQRKRRRARRDAKKPKNESPF